MAVDGGLGTAMSLPQITSMSASDVFWPTTSPGRPTTAIKGFSECNPFETRTGTLAQLRAVLVSGLLDYYCVLEPTLCISFAT